jgi:hypothetical protein
MAVGAADAIAVRLGRVEVVLCAGSIAGCRANSSHPVSVTSRAVTVRVKASAASRVAAGARLFAAASWRGREGERWPAW